MSVEQQEKQKKGRKYSYQVNLMTKENYQKYYRETVEKSENRMVFL